MRRAKTKKTSRISLLRQVSLFAGCTDDELGRIGGLLTAVSIGAGDTLVREGTIGRDFMVIEEGWARVTRGSVEVGILGPGSFFGEMALLGEPYRSATVTAISPMVVEALTRREFSELLRAAPSVRAKVEETSQRRADMNEQAIALDSISMA